MDHLSSIRVDDDNEDDVGNDDHDDGNDNHDDGDDDHDHGVGNDGHDIVISQSDIELPNQGTCSHFQVSCAVELR